MRTLNYCWHKIAKTRTSSHFSFVSQTIRRFYETFFFNRVDSAAYGLLRSSMMSMDKAAYYGDTGYGMAAEADYDDGYGAESEEASDTNNYDDGYGSEAESDFLALRPATTDVYVFVVNSDRIRLHAYR